CAHAGRTRVGCAARCAATPLTRPTPGADARGYASKRTAASRWGLGCARREQGRAALTPPSRRGALAHGQTPPQCGGSLRATTNEENDMSQRTTILAQILGFHGWKVTDIVFEDEQGRRIAPLPGYRVVPGTRMVLRTERKWAPRCSGCGRICRHA